ncbi:unnamed protein product, partial [marine sediment metagenome]
FPGFPLMLRGRIDRVDSLGEHKYRIIDYKTGGYSHFGKMRYFGGGRILQHALYSLAAEVILKKTGRDDKARVVESGYYFPTRRGEGKEIIVRDFDRDDFKALVVELLRILLKGQFVVNPEADCRFCDYVPICGAGAVNRVKEKRGANPEEFGIFDRLKEYE